MRHHVIARTRRFASTAAATLAILTATPIAFAQSGSPGNPSGGQAGGQDGGRQGGDGQGNRRGGGQNGGGQGGAGRTGRGFPGGGGGMADIREQLEPDFIRRDVPIFIQQLQLDSAQGLVLETLMGDYEESYQTASTEVQTEIRDLGRQVFSSMVSPEMRERMMTVGQEVQEDLRRLSEERGAPLSEEERRTFFRERMQQIQQQMAAERQAQGNDEMKRLMGDMFTRFEQWRVQKDSMRKDFVDGLKATLSEDQLALWPAFERFLNREKTLPKSRLMGEGVNLILVLDELELPAPAFEKVEPLLDQYEVRLDESLRARNDYLFESTAKLFKALEQGDADEANRIIERQVKHRTAVRDVNDEFRTTFVAALGEAPEAKMLESAILAEAYERVYRTTSTRRAFDAALAMEGLDPLVRDGVVNLEQGYGVELTDMNRDLYETIRKEEPSRTTRDAQRFVGFVTAAMSGDFSAMGGGMGGFGGMFGRGEDGPDPVREGFDKREKLEDGYLERLKLLLTPEQFATLPKPERGGRGGAGGGPGGGMTAMLDRLPADQKEAILKAADKNGNGQIDDDERGDAFRAMREIGGFGGRGGEQGGGQGGGGRGGEQGGGGRGQGGGGRGQGGGQGGNAGN